jgi:hypothetical protein
MSHTMPHWLHEKSKLDVDASRGEPRASCGLRSGNPGSTRRVKDRGFVADSGGSASGMGLRGARPDASEFESLDAQGEQTGTVGIKAGKTSRAPGAIDSRDPGEAGGRPGEGAPGVWIESCPLGWTDPGEASGASVRDKAEGATGAKVDASAGVPTEAGQLFVYSSASAGSEEFSQDVKKNFENWALGRPWSLKMRPVLACILV